METRAIARDGCHNTGNPLRRRIGLVTALLLGVLALAPVAATALEVSFTRVKPGVSFRVNVTGADAPRISSTRGKVGPVVRTTDGGHQALVSPDDRGTGEYRVTVSAGAQSITRTALVLKSVGDRWGQPQAVEGLVNTPGWEDSISISPDGQWLFLVYAPVSITCTWKSDHDDHLDFCERALGPWTGPARPDFIGTERISASGEVSKRCLGVKPPFWIPPFTTYGFRRQADGSFAEPFVLGVPNSGGCIVPGGVNVYPRPDGSAHMLYSWNDYWSDDKPGYVYSAVDIPKLGTRFILGTWEGTYSVGGTVKNYLGRALPIPEARNRLGHNAHGHRHADGSIRHVFFDHESGERDVYVTSLAPGGRYPEGPWTAPATVPAPISTDREEIMPFFDGERLTVRRRHGIASATLRQGADPAGADGWSDYEWDLRPDPSAWHTVGAIYTLGEPTRTDPAVWPGGPEVLYFNYAVREPDGSTNLNVGFVQAIR